MLKWFLIRRIPVLMGILWLFTKRKFLLDQLLWVLTKKVFVLIGNRYPRLSFLKSAGGKMTLTT